MKNLARLILVLSCLLIGNIEVKAQIQDIDTTFQLKPLIDKGFFNLQPLPFISANPSFGVLYGASLSSNFKFNSERDLKISNAVLTVTYTTLNQLLFSLKSNVYTGDNKWIFSGDWRYYITSQNTYGLGIGPSEDPLNTLHGQEQFMEFDLLRFHQSISHKISENNYVTAGVFYDRYSNINDTRLDLNSENPVYTSHYLYNNNYGFNLLATQSVGLGAGYTFDSRDLPTNASSGAYVSLLYKGYNKAIGNYMNAGSLFYDARYYKTIFKDREDVLAFWFMGNIVTHGKLPYMNLFANGWDQRGTSGRAFKIGRYRGESFLYAESEYRLRLPGLSKKHPERFGMVFFTNLSTASSTLDEIKVLEDWGIGYGLGLRVMLKKISKSNLTIDYARGTGGQNGIYINYNEMF